MKRYILHTLIILSLAGVFGCASRKKNTSQTRMYHAFFTRYNTYYNGRVAFDKGRDAQIEGHKDNYLERLPLLIVSDDNTKGVGKSDYDKAIEKSQKAIKNHSIKVKPRRETGKKLTPKKKRFYAQREFNPFLWRAWMMMADAYFAKGEFTEAAGTYIYISRLYENNPDVLAAARIGLAQCYAEMDWLYEAEDLLSRIRRDSVPSSLDRDLSRASANLLIRQGRYSEALPHMEKAVRRKGITSRERAREYYLMGQLYRETGDNAKAFKCFSKVISQSPPYELEVNARIRQTESLTGEDKKKIIRRLERMIKSPKNDEYLAQLYYALGNAHLSAQDTAKAVEAYETGIAKGKATGYGAGMIHLSLGRIYWEQQLFSKASDNYQKAIALIDEKTDGYDVSKHRSDVLSELTLHTDIVEKNTELLRWAELDEKALEAAVQRKIEQAEFEEKLRGYTEKKEQKAADAAGGSELDAASMAAGMNVPGINETGLWYFYNPGTVAQGIRSFSNTWGDRQLKDYWRLGSVNQAALPSASDSICEAGDSIASDTLSALTLDADSLLVPMEDAIPDTLSTDPTTREFWLQQIPQTEEQKIGMHTKLSDALFGASSVFEDKLGDKNLAISYWERLVNEYPDYERLAEAYYHLYLCCSRWDEPEKAAMYRSMLIAQFPDSSMAKRIQEPDFFESVAVKRHKEDSLYVDAYAAYMAGDYNAAVAANSYAERKYPDGAHRARFMFVDALAKMYSGRTDDALAALDAMTGKFTENEISAIATEISTGLKEGRLLHSGISTSIWERRADGTVRGDSDSLPQFSPERNEPYCFILAYPNDSLDEKRLLFELARYNFSRYMVRNFNMEFNRTAEITMLQVTEFLSYDEAFLYSKRLYANAEMARLLQGINAFVISKTNLDLLLNYYTFDDYNRFYHEELLSIPEPEIDGHTLDEPEYIDEENN